MKKYCSMFIAFFALAFLAGCFTSATAYTKSTTKDGVVTESKVKIIGTGDKASQVAAEGLFADGAPEDLGAGVKTASASQQSTGIKETLEGVGALLGPIAQMMAAQSGVPIPAKTTPTVTTPAEQDDSVATAPAESNTTLSSKIAEAKSQAKPLVVVAGSPKCGFCLQLEKDLAASSLSSRTDIVLVKEMSEWGNNSALAWTGGGNAPIVRVTAWNSSGEALCDVKLNRPTIAEIEAAISECMASK